MDMFLVFVGLRVIRDGVPQLDIPFLCVLVLRCTCYSVLASAVGTLL